MVAAVSSAPVGLAFAAAATALLAWHKAALADMPHNWQMGIQAPASPVASQIVGLHNMVLAIITVITVLVAALLAYVTWRYSAERNPTPSQTSHNTLLEVAWTVVPVLILVVIAIPSFRLVYYQDRTHDADMTIKVTGHQWYWEYTYPDSEGLNFGSRALEAKSVKPSEMKPGSMCLLNMDEPTMLPVGKNVRILTTSADVIHSFFVPSLGVQRYAIPGRTIETWVRIDKPGTYYGQCNQICGEDHSNMPITVRAIPAAEFTAWLAEAKKKYAADESIPSPAQDGRTAVLAAVRQ